VPKFWSKTSKKWFQKFLFLEKIQIIGERTMKENNPHKMLNLQKKTIAHLNYEQMYAIYGGNTWTEKFCIHTNFEVTLDCPRINC
jgi:hypothetical protein